MTNKIIVIARIAKDTIMTISSDMSLMSSHYKEVIIVYMSRLPHRNT
jgi:hypothetical protein